MLRVWDGCLRRGSVEQFWCVCRFTFFSARMIPLVRAFFWRLLCRVTHVVAAGA